MRRKKNLLPSPFTPDLYQRATSDNITETDVRAASSIVTMTQILQQALDPEFGVTPAQLGDCAEMFLSLLQLKRVTHEYYFEKLPDAAKLLSLTKQIEAEASLMHAEGVPQKVRETMEGAIEISMKEIGALRSKILREVNLLREIPLPGVKLN